MRHKFNPSHSRLAAAAAAAAAASTIFFSFSPLHPATLSAPENNRPLKIWPVCMITSSFPILNADAQGQAQPEWHMLAL